MWHRVAFTVDLTKRELGKFIDGSNVLSGPVGSSPGLKPMQYLDPSGGGGLDQRWSLYSTAMLFTDNDGKTRAGYVNSIQFRDTALSPAEIAALGGPNVAGIPVNIPALRIMLGTTNFLEGPSAGSDSVTLGVTPATATWSATTNDSWLHLRAANQRGVGNTNVIFSFDANLGATRRKDSCGALMNPHSSRRNQIP